MPRNHPRPRPPRPATAKVRAGRRTEAASMGGGAVLRDVESLRLGGVLSQRSLDPPDEVPTVQLRVMTFHPYLFKKMVKVVGGDPEPGDLVRIIDKRGEPFGWGLFNPRSKIVVRVLSDQRQAPDEALWQGRLDAALDLREGLLGLDAADAACRLVHAEGDGLPGLVVDRFADVLSVEVFSLATFQRVRPLLHALLTRTGARHFRLQADAAVQAQEGFRSSVMASSHLPERVAVREHGLTFQVQFEGGHKTGFFCDQRDNRLRFAQWCEGRDVLDLCCYSGGFSVHAAALGKARSVTAVDLDEKALAMARRNASENRAPVEFHHADAYDFLREAAKAGRQYDAVVLDPPKLIHSRAELNEGRTRYFDLNRLAFPVVRPGGLLLTCSCSGPMPADDFERLVHSASWQGVGKGSPQPRRRLQILARTGAAPDHPVDPECPETEYLKALWVRVE